MNKELEKAEDFDLNMKHLIAGGVQLKFNNKRGELKFIDFNSANADHLKDFVLG